MRQFGTNITWAGRTDEAGGGYFIRTRLNLGRAGDQAGISSKSAEEANIALAFSVGSLASWWVVSMKN